MQAMPLTFVFCSLSYAFSLKAESNLSRDASSAHTQTPRYLCWWAGAGGGFEFAHFGTELSYRQRLTYSAIVAAT